MSYSGQQFIEQDTYQESQGDSINPEEVALWSAFQAMHYILTGEEIIKVFGGVGFTDFVQWRNGLRK